MITIKVDTLLKEVYYEEPVIQYTNNEFTIELYEGEDELNMSESAHMTLKIRKPDGTITCNYVHILDGNEAYVRWDEAKEVPIGEYVMEFTLHTGLSSMKLPPIHITIIENPNGKPNNSIGLNVEYAVRCVNVSDGVYDFTFNMYNDLLHECIAMDFYVEGLFVSPQSYLVVPSSENNHITLNFDKQLVSGQNVELKILYITK